MLKLGRYQLRKIQSSHLKVPSRHIPVLNCLACLKTSSIPFVAHEKGSQLRRGSMTRYWSSAAQSECRSENRNILPTLIKLNFRPFEPLRNRDRWSHFSTCNKGIGDVCTQAKIVGVCLRPRLSWQVNHFFISFTRTKNSHGSRLYCYM